MALSRSALARTIGWQPPRLVDAPVRFSWPLGIGFSLFCFALSFPGRLNGDSLFSLLTATMPGMANNWHSATLVWFWSLPDWWLGQPAGALAMQAVLFGVFAGFMPRTPPTARGRAAFAGELLLRIVLAGAAGYIGKDALILLTLLIAVQVLRRLPDSGLDPVAIIGLGLVTTLFVLSKAPNFLVIAAAAALVLPFFVGAPGRHAALVAAVLAVGALAVPLNRAVDAELFAARDLHPDKQLVLFDLAGISVRTGENAFAGIAGWPTRTLPPPSACYVPYMWDSFAHWTACGGYAVAYDPFDGAAKRRWLEQLAAHPLAYAAHRLNYLGYLLDSRDQSSWGIAGAASNDATDPAALAQLRQGMADVHANRSIALWRPSLATAPLSWLERTFFKFYKVQWLSLLVCLAVLLASWLRRREGVRLAAVLAAGLGAGNVAMLAVFGVADPGRYVLPTTALAYLALLALLAPAAARRPGERRALVQR